MAGDQKKAKAKGDADNEAMQDDEDENYVDQE